MKRKPRTQTFGTTLDINDSEVDVTVEYIYSPGSPDVHYLSNGDPGYPGWAAEAEIVSVVSDADGKKLLNELPDSVLESLAEQALMDYDEA